MNQRETNNERWTRERERKRQSKNDEQEYRDRFIKKSGKRRQ